MVRASTIVVSLAIATLFAWAIPITRAFDAFQPMITALSIMIAAVFVRLNRGMPALEWKSVEPEKRKQLTTQILSLAKDYGWIIGINSSVLIWLVTLSVIGKAEICSEWPHWAQRVASGATGGMGALCVARMAYVVWRDIDVVALQKQLIDSLAIREFSQSQQKAGEEKVASMRAANIRKIEIVPPKAWGE